MNLFSICQGRDEHGKLKELHAKEFMIPPLLFAYNYGLAKYGNASEKKNFAITEVDLQKTLENIF